MSARKGPACSIADMLDGQDAAVNALQNSGKNIESSTNQECRCGTFGNRDGIRFCDSCHRYWNNDKELTAISRLLNLWPHKPSWDGVDHAVIANANERGRQVDNLLSLWLIGKLATIPSGTRSDAADLFQKLIVWPFVRDADISGTQVILSDTYEIAGTADIVGPGLIADLKTVYDLQPTYPLQLGGYCHLYEAQYGVLPKTCGIIHATARFKEPKWVPFEVSIVVSEFRVLRDFWRLVKRRTA